MSGDAIECEGVVVEEQRGGVYRVEVVIGETRREVLARLSGRLHQHRIRVVLGDTVQLEIGVYDLSRGRIVYRGRREERAR